jgi:Tfp pilus assembly protein PilP
MISTAQKKARENFKKAIEYRKKTGCTLKQAFAHISGKKTVTKKVATVKKASKNKIGAAPKIEYIFNAFKYKTNPKTGMFEVSEKKHFKIVGTNLRTAKDNAHKKYPYPWTIELENYSLKTSKKVGVIKKKVLRSPLKKKAVKKPSERSILNKIHKVKHDVEKLDKSQKKHMMSGVDKMDFTRINNDINGNPRYVIHFLDILNMEEREFLPFSKKYIYSLKKAKLIGGKKYDNKQYGGGIVFQSYNIQDLENRINNLRIKTPKIKY